MSQHDLMVEVLRAAGGEVIEPLAPPGYAGKIADILFADDNVIVEIKSFTTDRAASEATSNAVVAMFETHVHLGAPIIFGTITVSAEDLERPIAANMLRIAGKRVQDEMKHANSQIKATKKFLGRPDALGVIVLITPPFRLDRKSIVWLVGDAMREGRCSSIEELFLIETPLGMAEGANGPCNSFMSLHTRPEGSRAMPRHLVQSIDRAWGAITGQLRGEAEQEDYHLLGATS